MIVKILGAIDVFIGCYFLLTEVFNLFPVGIGIFLGLVLIVKGGAFAINFNVTSVLDILSGAILVLSSFILLPNFFVILISIFLIQKGLISFF